LIVLGFGDPRRMRTKGRARPGARLVLSKPPGLGTTTTALKRDLADPVDVAEVVGWMKRLNKQASELAVEFAVRGGTDVTGFSVLGHAWEMAQASGVGLRFDMEVIPFTSGARKYAGQWIFPGGSSDNRLYYQAHVRFAGHILESDQMLLFDAQTSGGLLLAVPADRLENLLRRADQVGQPLWVVGEVLAGGDIQVA
jgi:selenide,water dikinase